MNILIIEDEKIASDNLAAMLQIIEPQCRIVAQIESVRGAVKWFSTNTPDLIFCDIQLSDGISFSIFDQLNITTPVIFTTAFDQYAIRAFKVNSIDYLLKPLDQHELTAAMNKFRSLQSHPATDFKALLMSLTNKTEYQERLMVYSGQKIKSIKTSDIRYFFTREGSVFFTIADGMTYDTDHTLDKLEELLDPRQFYRINRQMIIHVDAIDSMYSASKSRIKLDLKPPFDQEMFVSFNNTPGFKLWLNK